MGKGIFELLSEHISRLAIGPPYNDHLVQILRENFDEREAEILLTLPTGVAPFKPVTIDEIATSTNISKPELTEILNRLASRGLLFKGRGSDGKTGYSFLQFGYGMPQAIFWPNEDTPTARRMAELCIRHSSSEVLIQAFGGPGTKVFRWLPINRRVEYGRQAVLPYARIEHVILSTTEVALVNCNCRVMSRLKGRAPCDYPLDVCMKYDDLAEYVIDMGIGRKVSKDEAMAISQRAEEAGCVHFADNLVEGEIRHACNCCPCCCWSLGNYKRRRVPRDLLMACQFIRETEMDNCVGCGQCADACPINAVRIEDGTPQVDLNWCIGCGVCSLSCPTGAITMVRREAVAEPLVNMEALSRDRIAQKSPTKIRKSE
jgi:Pyruvate/2-oxoacid:ferredoxin oxidoreductase delta subunit